MDRSLSQESGERTLFFSDLDSELKWLRGRITIISSPTNGVGSAAQYPWLWRYVSNFTVGSKSRATQHAKFWAFHWVIGDEEQLDLYISSANLTRAAFRDNCRQGGGYR